MIIAKPVGRAAPALKYDVLTALGAHALRQAKGVQRLILRLMTLITARYNWTRDELSVGQREIARLWQVDERTVKREMARLRAMGWLVVRRQGARGRVTEYSIDLTRILDDTQHVWPDVGPDFEHRLGVAPPPVDSKIVALPSRGISRVQTLPDDRDGSEWALAQRVLYAEEPARYGAWIAALTRIGRAGGQLRLRAPSRFHATYAAQHLGSVILDACRAVDGSVLEVTIEA